jgi:hypothetical protein
MRYSEFIEIWIGEMYMYIYKNYTKSYLVRKKWIQHGWKKSYCDTLKNYQMSPLKN